MELENWKEDVASPYHFNLYLLGCRCTLPNGKIGVLSGLRYTQSGSAMVSVNVLGDDDIVYDEEYHYSDLILRLRNYMDMTEEEVIGYMETLGARNCEISVHKNPSGSILAKITYPDGKTGRKIIGPNLENLSMLGFIDSIYLCSIGVDILGLLDMGIAVYEDLGPLTDKEKMR